MGPMIPFRRPIFKVLMQQYFFLALVLISLVIAELFPWIGSTEDPLFPHIPVKCVAVAAIFFSSGISIKPSDLIASLKMYKLHMFVQIFSYVLTPLAFRAALLFIQLFLDLNKWIVTGLIAVSCIPPPVSSAVILTKASKGNESAAILSSALGGVLGIFTTPILLVLHIGMSCTLSLRNTMLCLLGTVGLPLLAGQLIRRVSCPTCWLRFAALLPQGALIVVIFTSFCEMFLQTELTISAQEVLTTLVIVITLQISLMYLSLRSILLLNATFQTFTAADTVAIIFCSAQKSLTFGLPLLRTLYGGYSHLSQISLPLLIYHPVQLIIGALIAPYAKQWIDHHYISVTPPPLLSA